MGDRHEPDRDTRGDQRQALEEIRLLFARYRQVGSSRDGDRARRAGRAVGRRVKGRWLAAERSGCEAAGLPA